MKICIGLSVLTLGHLALACGGSPKAAEAQPAPAETTTEPAAATPAAAVPDATYSGDLSGLWSFTMSDRSVSGPCPAGPNTSGELELIQKGSTFTLTFVSGQTCKPESMCQYAGSVEGERYSGSNSDAVDSEGGKVTNTIEVAASSATAARAKGTSTYSHPSGMSCKWSYLVTMTKK